MRVVYLSESPPRKGEPIAPGTQRATGIPVLDDCDSVNDYGAVDADGHLIALIYGACGINGPWVVADPVLTVRNATGNSVQIGPTKNGPQAGTQVVPGTVTTLPITTDEEGCDPNVDVTAWASDGSVLATRPRACLNETWTIDRGSSP